MAIRRIFLDWSHPALPAAAAHLISRYARGDTLDLSQAVIVVPGLRAGRRLLEILVERAEDGELLLTPPQIVTEGRLPELLYVPKRPFADELTQKLAWADAARLLPADKRSALLPHPPPAGDTLRWLELGDLLRRLHLELAADGLNFAEVLKRGPQVSGFAEEARWQALREIQRAYLRRLDELELWDIQTARLEAIKRREIETEKDLIFVGAVDLNRSIRQMLDLVAERVTALVHAPPDLADRFDEHGCLIAAAWRDAEIPLTEQQIQRADGPADQADAVARALASLNGMYRSEEVVIGMPDPSLAPHILRQLAQCGITGRWVEGRRIAETGPYRLLSALADYAERGEFAGLTRLARHPDVELWLQDELKEESTELLTALDDYQASALPMRLDVERLKRDMQDERHWEERRVAALHAQIEKLLPAKPAAARPLSEWIEPMRQSLTVVYGGRTIDRDDVTGHYLEKALREVIVAIQQLDQVPNALEPMVNFSEAVHLALAPLQASSLPPPADPGAVELLGWLELPLDDAPALVVTSMNEGIVPASGSAEVFLPNELRRHLEIEDNDRRYARDAYALSALAASRQQLTLVVGHRDVEGNPLAPSRLLFAADGATVARRALALFKPPATVAARRQLRAGLPSAPLSSLLSPPMPRGPREPLERMPVTRFRSYLACPYRYYLQYVLKLGTRRDEAEELDGALFGNLVHDVLEHFGRQPEARQLDEADAIFEFLDQRLSAVAGARYGSLHSRPAVRMQVEQIRLRLREFARIQAEHRAAGWEIIHSEDTEKQLAAGFDVDGRPIMLCGRIDRIDWHRESNTILVLDYKSADAGDPPEKVHCSRGEWVDLQLPLYRHLVRAIGRLEGPKSLDSVKLGFCLLPKDPEKCGICIADWSDADLAQADETAREVIRKIRKEIFWPPADPPPPFCEDLAPICQDHCFGNWQAREGDDA